MIISTNTIFAIACELLLIGVSSSFSTHFLKGKRSSYSYSSLLSSQSHPKRIGPLAVTLDGKDIRGPITPLGNFVLVKVKETLSSTTGGILLPDQSLERPSEGDVVAAGPGKIHPHTGVRIHCPVNAGMSVLYGKFDGTKLNYDDEDMHMIRDDDILLYYSGQRMMIENVTPCRDYVLIQNDSSSLETDSGIVVANSVTKDLETCEGNVLKVGEGRMSSVGDFTPAPVQPGDRVKFRDYSGNDVRIDGKDYSLVRMVDILCAIEN